jgi:hypothetical protein
LAEQWLEACSAVAEVDLAEEAVSAEVVSVAACRVAVALLVAGKTYIANKLPVINFSPFNEHIRVDEEFFLT